ncbi:hypothetical protein S7335_690 [Synechococcus sp. PCC 7335]|nr:hypothetical protein S7335_690 [Synechococcus sp. PCC 7335]
MICHKLSSVKDLIHRAKHSILIKMLGSAFTGDRALTLQCDRRCYWCIAHSMRPASVQ